MTSGAAPLVRLRDAHKRYRFRAPWVLSDVNVSVLPERVVEVRGANGAGKSTLLRLLAGATLPTRGRRLAAEGLSVGYGPERLAPAPPFTARAFLAHHARLRRLAARDGERRVAQLAERLGLTERLLDEPLVSLSKGSLQKVVIIQALLGASPVVVLDEPFAGLDRDARAALTALLREACADGAAVVFSDHGERDAGLRAQVLWSVSDGGVRERSFTAPAPALPPIPGLLAQTTSGSRVRIVVEAGAGDPALVALLAHGWHVLDVAADDAAGRTVIETTPPGPS